MVPETPASPLVISLYCAALLLIVALSVYAGWLWHKVWQRRRQATQLQQRRRAVLAADLRILATSLLEGQLPLIEGAIRIKVLLDNHDPVLTGDPQVAVLHQIYSATAHIPTHAAWKALGRDERRRFEADLHALDVQHGEDVRRAARWLLDEALPA
ncbi:DUF2489 domain-containing protein [Pseudomonas sp. ABC1]|uniref:DUF2489 domain-containing protein n=1 Tax=Pseudomonas sp. ABC1 TaxID=2748080 RepID=UPI00211A2FF1|nr:DUF2489 domain-containing protein [Pseudomonas sp. ABC1]